ncbi:hypothetical protein [Salmonella enterica]|uniref:hypothetical protein n=1 Tax=Salmonella enterica TaxID=28901 RepID=UPI0013B47508|nr:hypothetical protein [Salmonella enterica]ELJ5777184.1 hypothetical protein [Morganella morganii]EDZ2074326.1 hypothetical protein [Salmonella enterica]EDZ4360314.1 hypothetical protein [Salmonella enterica]EEA0842775.1 hypothetical protein [Salmonella enterica]EEG3349990.1 hypothetical protein [Salmonella enterica]
MTNIYAKVIATIFVCFSLSACAPVISGSMNAFTTETDVIQKTAKYFGVEESKIKISNIDKGALSTEYNVNYNGAIYGCRIYYGEVACEKRG